MTTTDEIECITFVTNNIHSNVKLHYSRSPLTDVKTNESYSDEIHYSRATCETLAQLKLESVQFAYFQCCETCEYQFPPVQSRTASGNFDRRSEPETRQTELRQEVVAV